MKRLKKQEIIFFVLVLAVIAAGLLLPKTGELVLLDEPASNLDFCNQKIMLDALMRIKTGTGIIMISHMPEHAFACCEKVLMLNADGSYLFGETEQIITEERLNKAYRTDMVIVEKQDASGRLYRGCCIRL